MRIVLDTSAALALAFKEPGYESVRNALAGAEWIDAPDLFIAEVTNGCWKRHRQGRASLEHCEQALAHAMGLPDRFVSAESLHVEAFTMAVSAQRAAYDMFYLVLARRTGAHLMTTDRGLMDFATRNKIRLVKG